MLKAWRSLPQAARRVTALGFKAAITVGAFYLLFSHRVQTDSGAVTIWQALRTHLGEIDVSVAVPFLLLAAGIKFVGIFASMLRWHLLLIGQGIRFRLWHIVGSFLIGRFLGTFLPSTLGLDGYKLYDAARFSGRVVEPAAATAVEKAMGLSGVFLCFLVTLPLGYTVLGSSAGLVALVTVPLAALAVVGLFLLLFSPSVVVRLLSFVPAFGRRTFEGFVTRVSRSASAYRGRFGLLAAVSLLSFVVHFCTAVMYFFTALAVGAVSARFWEVSFASTIQIFATVMSPFTIAGEGVREIVQALFLAKRIGASESVLSAALGFWAAEALTLVGAFFWWGRRGDYRPPVTLTGAASEVRVETAAEPVSPLAPQQSGVTVA